MIALWWVKPLAYLLTVAALLGGFAAFVSHERTLGSIAGRAALQKGYDEGYAKATAAANALFEKKQTAVEDSHAADLKRDRVQIAAGLAARTELGRLRNRLSRPSAPAAGASTATGPGADDTAALRAVLGACAGRYEEVAGDAGRLANQVTGLQGFILADQIGGTSVTAPAGERSRAGDLADSALATQPATVPPRQTPGEAVPPQGETTP